MTTEAIDAAVRDMCSPGEWIRDGDKVIRMATAGVVTIVAGFAAVVSFSHIYGLALRHGQSGIAARLLPLSVDGLILAASLVLLHEARNGRGAPWFAEAMLGLGVAATVAANVADGLPSGWLAAVISAWPAVAFVGAVEMMMLMVRRARGGDVRGDIAPDMSATAGVTPAAAHVAPKVTRTAPAKESAMGVTPQDMARQIRAAEPDITNKELAGRVGVSVRTLQRWQDGGSTPDAPPSSVVAGPWPAGESVPG